MISDYTEFSKDGLTVVVNWNEAVTPCKVIKFIIDGKERLIERDDFYAMMMLFGDEKQQTDLIPVQQTQVRAIRRLLKIRVQKPMRAGEVIVVPHTYFVPEKTYESLMLKKDHEGVDLADTNLAKIVNHL